MWQELNAYKHAGMVKRFSCSSDHTLLGEKKWATPKMAKYQAFNSLNNKSLVRN